MADDLLRGLLRQVSRSFYLSLAILPRPLREPIGLAYLLARAADTVADTRLFLRPFTALGFNTHVQGGANYDLWKFLSVGASGYAILPSGQQTIFSKVVNGSSSGHGHAFENNQQTSGSADLARDHGFSAWVDANPAPYLDLELGYTRSVNYDLNAVSFGIGINVGYLARRNSGD